MEKFSLKSFSLYSHEMLSSNLTSKKRTLEIGLFYNLVFHPLYEQNS